MQSPWDHSAHLVTSTSVTELHPVTGLILEIQLASCVLIHFNISLDNQGGGGWRCPQLPIFRVSCFHPKAHQYPLHTPMIWQEGQPVSKVNQGCPLGYQLRRDTKFSSHLSPSHGQPHESGGWGWGTDFKVRLECHSGSQSGSTKA